MNSNDVEEKTLTISEVVEILTSEESKYQIHSEDEIRTSQNQKLGATIALSMAKETFLRNRFSHLEVVLND